MAANRLQMTRATRLSRNEQPARGGSQSRTRQVCCFSISAGFAVAAVGVGIGLDRVVLQFRDQGLELRRVVVGPVRGLLELGGLADLVEVLLGRFALGVEVQVDDAASVILVVGGVVFIRFLRDYPVMTMDEEVDSGQ